MLSLQSRTLTITRAGEGDRFERDFLQLCDAEPCTQANPEGGDEPQQVIEEYGIHPTNMAHSCYCG